MVGQTLNYEGYYSMALEVIKRDRTSIKEELAEINSALSRIDNELSRYRSSKNYAEEQRRDNKLQKDKAQNITNEEHCNKILQKIDLVKQVLTSNKKTIISKRIKSEEELLRTEVKERKKNLKAYIHQLNQDIANAKESHKFTSQSIEKTDTKSIFGKIKGTYFNVRLSMHEKRLINLKEQLKENTATLKILSGIKTVRTSQIYTELKNDIGLDSKGAYYSLFNAETFYSYDIIDALEKKYSELSEELKKDHYITANDIYETETIKRTFHISTTYDPNYEEA